MKFLTLSLLLIFCSCEKSEPTKKIEGKYYNEVDRHLRKPIDQANEVNKINKARSDQMNKYLNSEDNN
jgi:hypothetical protein